MEKYSKLVFILAIAWVVYFILYSRMVTNKLNGKKRTHGVQIFSNAEAIKLPSVSLFVRLTGMHIKRFYCDFLRTMVLFWPPSYGNLVVVLDEESQLDRKLAAIMEDHFAKYFPKRILKIVYESLPEGHETLLKLPWPKRDTGYNRQIWSSFYNDLYTNDTVIAWVDSDTAFSASVTDRSMYNGTKLRVIGTDCTLRRVKFARLCDKNVFFALGQAAVADFMLHFPIYIYRDTFANCRKFLIKRFKAQDFEEVYKSLSAHGLICPVTLVLNYAWHFERERYEWSLKICTASLDQYNRKFGGNAKIRPSDIRQILSDPQLSIHTGKPGSALASAQLILTSYCLSNKEAGITAEHCVNDADYNITNALTLLKYGRAPKTCVREMLEKCLDILRQHYRLVGSEIRSKKRVMNWSDVVLVETLVQDVNGKCPTIHTGSPRKRIPIV
ncbi:uncharacterized protein LOC124457885 [Xenia sp. Carnegie-2017]|uniref:uncharacterized protein LOC124457885 n=1 Tax=Xenia sp. Carnegie-2017 TaxID=2897299 RepID=UPI001F04EDF5|nr:uncharacterized protein LOC124457885 [Xenia sp. Carnegie-2017]